MKAIHNRAFQKVVECPTCGAPLKVTNLTQWVIRECSEDDEHLKHETRRANNPIVLTDALTGEYVRHKDEAEDFAAFLADVQAGKPDAFWGTKETRTGNYERTTNRNDL